jgi:serine/threonine protein kinase/tetratricopeptide (TPR) repeat protein
MKCPKCKADNPDTKPFCADCGTQLTPSEDAPPSITKTLETPREELTTGSTFAGRYQIIEELGKGGMGKVYRALDKKLNEEVALKLIKPDIASDKNTIERFKNELKLARKIRQKNVGSMYELLEDKGIHFITMEYVSGQDLKKLIRQTGQLTVGKAISIAKQICDGLSEAHSLGVVHRDLKPNNIMIDQGGNAKIMDFGIARAVKGKSITGPGVMIGTPQYMSPEQVEGKDVDQKSDIYSLGIILYEMLTDRVPFEGDTPLTVGVKQKTEIPKDPRDFNERIPDELNRLILKCLEKDQENRYQSTEALKSDLVKLEQGLPTTDRVIPKKKIQTSKEITVQFNPKKILIPALVIAGLAIIALVLWHPWSPRKEGEKLSAKPSLPGFQKLAVLPFANIKSDPQTDYLGFALADQIIGDLAYVKNVVVRPSSAVRQYQDKEVDAQSAGNALKVDFIVMGHYLKEGDVVRLNIELVNVHSNEMIWREPIQVRYDNVFELQDLVTKKVIDGLKIQFLQDERGRIQTDVPQNPLAYEYYLRSISYPFSNEGDQLASEMLKKSIELDPNYAPAYSQLGERSHRLAQYGLLDPDETNRAENYLLKALSLNGELLSALGHLAMRYTETARSEKAVEITRQMLEINPNNASAHFSLGYIYRYAGMLNESVLEMEKAVSLDPKNQEFRSIIITYRFVGEYEKAIETSRIYKESAFTLGEQGEAFLRQGKQKQAIACFDRVIAMEPDGLMALSVTGMKAFIEGNIDNGRDAGRKFEQYNIADAEAWYHFASYYGLLGDTEGCIRTLQRAVDGGFFNYPLMLTDSFLDSVRDDPEFQRILDMARAKHEAFKKRFFPPSPPPGPGYPLGQNRY